MPRGVRIVVAVWVLCLLGIAGRLEAQSWTGTDIGQVAIAGTSTVSGSRITINAEGSDIWNTADSCYFVYRPLTANGEVTARVSSLTAVTGWTKGGVMIRQSLSANSMMAALLATPSNGLAFEQRTSSGVAAVNTRIDGAAPPVWLRLSRSGTVIAAYRSTNGTSWSYIARADIGFSGTVYVGFAVSSNGASRLATGTFDSPALSTTVSTAPPSGPVAAFAFDEGTGTTTRDIANNATGTLAGGVSWTTGRTARALSFNGSTGNVTVPDSALLDLTTAATVEAWVMPTSSTGVRSVAAKELSGGVAYQLSGSTSAGRPAGAVTIGSTTSRVSGPSTLAANAWSHVAATYDGAALNLYVNGQKVATRALTGSIAVTSGVLRIGGSAALADWFQGRIDDLRIYRRSLSWHEILTDRNNPVRSASAPSSDTTRPTVSITSPAAGAVTGTVTLSANASDNVGVASVQFRVNGANVGAADTSAPYSTTWNTSSLAAGTYSITAVATDTSGNQTTSAAVSVTISSNVVINARSVTFDSASHNATVSGQAVVSSYRLEIWAVGANTTSGTPLYTSSMAKPVSSTTALTFDQSTFFGTLPKNQQFIATVSAIGPGGSSRSGASGAFSMQ